MTTTRVWQDDLDGAGSYGWLDVATGATIPHGGYGTWKPSAASTGPRVSLSSLSNFNDPTATVLTLPTSLDSAAVAAGWVAYKDGYALHRKKIHGRIEPPTAHATNIYAVDCQIVGRDSIPTSETGCVNMNVARSGAGKFIMENCLIEPQTKADGRDCIRGFRWEAYRCNITGGVDCVGLMRAAGGALDVVMKGCWLHDMVFVYPDMAHTDGTHNDLVQHHSGSGFTLLGNTFECTIGTIIGTPPTESVARLDAGHGHNGVLIQGTGSAANVVESNWFTKGINHSNLQASCTWKNNKHYADAWYPRYIYRTSGATVTDIGTNTWASGPNAGQLMTSGNSGLLVAA